MVYPAGNPLPSSPGGVPVVGNAPTYTPAVQLPAAAQPPVAVPPVAVPPQTWSPDTTQFSQQAIQAATAPQAQATVVPASNPQGYTQLWAQAPETSLWETEWKNGQSPPPQAPPVIVPPPVIVSPPIYTPPVVQPPIPQPTTPPVVQPPIPQPTTPPVATPPAPQQPAPQPPAPPTPAPVEPPPPDSSPSPVGGLPQTPEPEPAPVYPDPPNETPSPLGGLPDVAEPEPAPEPEPTPPSHTPSPLGGLPKTEEPEPAPQPESKPKPEPKPTPKPEPKPDGITGRSWKVVADPHVTTGDGKQFDASLAGRFTLLRSADGKFEVQNKQDQIPGDRGIWNTALTVKSHSDTVTYDAPGQTLTVNDKKVAFKAGTKIKLPDGGRLEMTNSEYSPGKFAPRVQVVTPEGDRVAFLILQRKNGGRYVDLYGNIGAKRQPGEMSGMVGAFDADSKADNDLKLRNGKTASSVDAFLKDWKLN